MGTLKQSRCHSSLCPLLTAVIVILIELCAVPSPVGGRPINGGSKLPLLTRVKEVRELPRDQADFGYRVRLRGIVTYYDPDWLLFFIQDSTGGIYVYPKGIALPLHAGQRVEIEGFAGSGKTTPIVYQPRIQILGQGSLPDPKRVSMGRLMTGLEDGQWVETDAVVRSATTTSEHYLQLKLASEGSHLRAFIPNVRGVDPARFVGAQVRVRGVCATEFGAEHQALGPLLYVPDLGSLEVMEQASPNPFAQPALSMATLTQLTANPVFADRVKVQGVVTLQRPAEALVHQDGNRMPVNSYRADDRCPARRSSGSCWLRPRGWGPSVSARRDLSPGWGHNSSCSCQVDG